MKLERIPELNTEKEYENYLNLLMSTEFRFQGLNGNIANRFSLLYHHQVLPVIFQGIIPYNTFQFNYDKTIAIMQVHDHAEMHHRFIQNGFRDFPTQEKMKWKGKTKENMEKLEEQAMKFMASLNPSTYWRGFNYLELLQEGQRKESLEAQICSCIDKLEGGISTIQAILETPQNCCKEPLENYKIIIPEVLKKFPQVEKIFRQAQIEYFWDKKTWEKLTYQQIHQTQNNPQNLEFTPYKKIIEILSKQNIPKSVKEIYFPNQKAA